MTALVFESYEHTLVRLKVAERAGVFSGACITESDFRMLYKYFSLDATSQPRYVEISTRHTSTPELLKAFIAFNANYETYEEFYSEPEKLVEFHEQYTQYLAYGLSTTDSNMFARCYASTYK